MFSSRHKVLNFYENYFNRASVAKWISSLLGKCHRDPGFDLLPTFIFKTIFYDIIGQYNYHSLVGYSTDCNPFDSGSNPQPDKTFLLYKSVIYWYHIFLNDYTLLLFFHVVFSVLVAALYIGV